MTTETERRYSERRVEHYRGVPSDAETLHDKMGWLNELLMVARDYKVGVGLIELAHNRIDEAMTILAGPLAPWELKVKEDADEVEEAAA
jgi:hypothetical protein